jgi:hypothetical protein
LFWIVILFLGRRSEFNEDENVHNVANVLLYWLKSLTNTIIPHQHYQRLIDTNNLSAHKRARVFKDVFETLPKLRLEMLRRIIRLARKLALVKLAKLPGKEKEKEKEKTRIFEEEAAIFAPFILRPKEGKGTTLCLYVCMAVCVCVHMFILLDPSFQFQLLTSTSTHHYSYSLIE